MPQSFAVTCLLISPYGYADDGTDVAIESEHTVTVQDVMQGLCDYYEPGVGYDSCHYFFEGFYKSKHSTENELILEAHWGS
jgi:hypothetical protein